MKLTQKHLKSTLSWLGLLTIGAMAIAWYQQSPLANQRVLQLLTPWQSEAPLPDYSILDLEGRRSQLSDYRGQPLLLDFWASWCPPCRLSMPELEQFQDKYRGRVQVLAVNVMEDWAAARRFAEKSGYGLRFVRADALAQHLDIQVLPSKVLLDAEGRPVWSATGHIPLLTHFFLEAHLE